MNPEKIGGARVAITGIGSTPFGVFPGEDAYSLGSAALRPAMREAGVSAADIDGLIVCRIPDYQRFGELHGFNPQFALNLPGQGRMAAIALQLACQAIASGAASNVALVYGNDGRTAGMKYGGEGDGYGSGGAGLWFPYGMTSPGAVHAMMIRRYEHLYGATAEALAKVAVTCRGHAVLNPGAVMKKAFTTEEYYASKFIAAPLRLFDYCLINDGGIALIVTRADRVDAATVAPVYVAGVSTATVSRTSFAEGDPLAVLVTGPAAATVELPDRTLARNRVGVRRDGRVHAGSFRGTYCDHVQSDICGRGVLARFAEIHDLVVDGRTTPRPSLAAAGGVSGAGLACIPRAHVVRNPVPAPHVSVVRQPGEFGTGVPRDISRRRPLLLGRRRRGICPRSGGVPSPSTRNTGIGRGNRRTSDVSLRWLGCSALRGSRVVADIQAPQSQAPLFAYGHGRGIRRRLHGPRGAVRSGRADGRAEPQPIGNPRHSHRRFRDARPRNRRIGRVCR